MLLLGRFACSAKCGCLAHGSWCARGFRADEPLAFFHFVETVGGQIGECFHLPGGPNNLGFVDPVMGAEPEVNAQSILSELAAAAQHFTRLNEISGSRLYACV